MPVIVLMQAHYGNVSAIFRNVVIIVAIFFFFKPRMQFEAHKRAALQS